MLVPSSKVLFGNEVYNLTNYLGEFYNQAQYNKNSTILDAWRPDNTDTEYTSCHIG